jgi:hypothetical protein
MINTIELTDCNNSSNVVPAMLMIDQDYDCHGTLLKDVSRLHSHAAVLPDLNAQVPITSFWTSIGQTKAYEHKVSLLYLF